jgi:hypothetical protein
MRFLAIAVIVACSAFGCVTQELPGEVETAAQELSQPCYPDYGYYDSCPRLTVCSRETSTCVPGGGRIEPDTRWEFAEPVRADSLGGSLVSRSASADGRRQLLLRRGGTDTPLFDAGYYATMGAAVVGGKVVACAVVAPTPILNGEHHTVCRMETSTGWSPVSSLGAKSWLWSIEDGGGGAVAIESHTLQYSPADRHFVADGEGGLRSDELPCQVTSLGPNGGSGTATADACSE